MLKFDLRVLRIKYSALKLCFDHGHGRDQPVLTLSLVALFIVSLTSAIVLITQARMAETFTACAAYMTLLVVLVRGHLVEEDKWHKMLLNMETLGWFDPMLQNGLFDATMSHSHSHLNKRSDFHSPVLPWFQRILRG